MAQKKRHIKIEDNKRICHLDLRHAYAPGERVGGPEAIRKAVESRKATTNERLTPQEKRFCQLYVKTGKGGQSVMDAGYNFSNKGTAATYSSDLLNKPKIQKEIQRLQSKGDREAIATANEVMEFFTRMMTGEEKDQFGLEISAADRLKAAIELAKRTVDLENKLKASQSGEDNTITIKLDWGGATPQNTSDSEDDD